MDRSDGLGVDEFVVMEESIDSVYCAMEISGTVLDTKSQAIANHNHRSQMTVIYEWSFMTGMCFVRL